MTKHITLIGLLIACFLITDTQNSMNGQSLEISLKMDIKFLFLLNIAILQEGGMVVILLESLQTYIRYDYHTYL